MKFISKILSFFIPLMILPVIVSFIIFFMVTRNSLTDNRNELLSYTGNSLYETVILEIRELKAARLYESAYFRKRMFKRVLSSSAFPEDDIVFVVETPAMSLIYGTRDDEDEIAAGTELINEIRKAAAGDKGVKAKFLTIENRVKYLVYARDLPAKSGYLVLLSPVDKIYEPLLQVFPILISAILLILGGFILLTVRASVSFTRPLTVITGGVNEISRGSLDVRLEQHPEIRELGILVDSINNMTSNLQEEIEKRRNSEIRLQTSLSEKDVLLKEVHHRVKNNMQIISSLLELQSRLIDSPDVDNVFKIAVGRINTMALIHEKLYQSDDFSYINLASYIEELISDLLSANTSESFDNILSIEPMSIGTVQIIPLGLIINELVINTIRHGLVKGEKNIITIEAYRAESESVIQYSDSGRGPEASDLKSDGKSLGFELINSLCAQLNGRFSLEDAGGKTIQQIVYSI